MKPYIICHMVASVDGRIDCSMVDKISGDEYYTIQVSQVQLADFRL